MRWLGVIMTLVVSLSVFAESGPIPRVVRLDVDGDILPEGAIARLGSRRFRDSVAYCLFVDDTGRIVSCFQDNAVRWWDLETGKYRRGWAAPEKCRVWYSADGRLAAWKMADGLRVWDTWNDRGVRDLPLHGDSEVLDAAFSTDSRSLAAGTRNSTDSAYPLRVWDLKSGRETLVGRSAAEPYELRFSDRDRVLIVWPADYKVAGWDVRGKKVRWLLPLSRVHHVDRTGRRFVAEFAPDESLGLFDAATGQPIPDAVRIADEENRPRIIAISPDGRTVIRSQSIYGDDHAVIDEAVTPWDFLKPRSENKVRLSVNFGGVLCSAVAAAFTPDGKRVVLSVGARLHVYDVSTGKRLTPDFPTWGDHRTIRQLYWSGDGKRILISFRPLSPDEPLDTSAWIAATGRFVGRVWHRRAYEDYQQTRHLAYDGGQFRRELRGPTPCDASGRRLLSQRGLTHTADGALLACGRFPNEPIDYDPEQQKKICLLPSRRFPLEMETPSVVDALSGRALVTLPIALCGNIAFSPDNRSLAAIQPDGVHLYDVLTGKQRLVRKIHTRARREPNSPVADGLSFSPDGSKLAVVEFDGTILIFDVALAGDSRSWEDSEADQLWAALASPEPRTAWAAIFRLVYHPDRAMKLFSERLRPVGISDKLDQVINDLDSPIFRVRETASKRLLGLGDAIRPEIAKALQSHTDAEKRTRLEAMARALADDQLPQAVDLQRLRALMALARINSSAARQMIGRIAEGMDSARATREAKATKKRLGLD